MTKAVGLLQRANVDINMELANVQSDLKCKTFKLNEVSQANVEVWTVSGMYVHVCMYMCVCRMYVLCICCNCMYVHVCMLYVCCVLYMSMT